LILASVARADDVDVRDRVAKEVEVAGASDPRLIALGHIVSSNFRGGSGSGNEKWRMGRQDPRVHDEETDECSLHIRVYPSRLHVA
jgi:hypothetical protein